MWISFERPTSNELWVTILNSYVLGLPTSSCPDTICVLVSYLVRNIVTVDNLAALISVGYIARKCIGNNLWKLHTLGFRDILVSLAK